MGVLLSSFSARAEEKYDYTVSGSIDKSGRTNVSSELNSILSLASKNGTNNKPSVVYIPDGTYYIGDTPLVIGSNTILHLSDKAIIKFSNNLKTGDIQMLISSKSVASGYNGMSNVEIYGGVWDANQNSTQIVSEDGTDIKVLAYAFAHSQNIKIHDTTIKNIRGEHAIIFDGCKDITVENVVFQDFYPMGNKVADSMEALHFDFCNAAGSVATPQDDTPCQNIKVIGCTFSNVSGGVGAHHDEKTISSINKNFYFSGNTFRNVSGNAIDATYIDGVTISNNSGIGIKGDFIQAYSSKNLTIENNNVDGARYGAYINYGNHGVDNIVIKNNIINNTSRPGIMAQVDDNYISQMNTETSITISNNELSGTSSYGIITTAFKSKIENNKVDSVKYVGDIVTEKDGVTGIKLRYTKIGSVISGNSVTNTSRGIEAVYSDNVVIKNNDISNYSSEGIRTLGSGNVIESNTIKKGKMGIWFQFYPGTGGKDIIRNNIISNSSKEGIWAFSDSANIRESSNKSINIEGNSICDVCDFGICVQYFGDVSISNNRINSVSMSAGSSLSKLNVSGIKVEKTISGASISNNYILNTYTGIWTTACCNANIFSNSIKNASSNGMRLTSACTGMNIYNNSLVGCSSGSSDDESSNTILSIESKGLTVSNNMVFSNGQKDITVWGPSTNEKTTIVYNSVKGAPDGRIFSNSVNNDIHDNGEALSCNVSGDKTELSVGKSCLLIYPNDNVEWKSSDSGIASVDYNGCVRALKVGQCVVSVVENGNIIANQQIVVSSQENQGSNSSGNNGQKNESPNVQDNQHDDGSAGENNDTTPGYRNEWINGRWYDENGNQTYEGTLSWKNNYVGWWVEDSSGWYPVSQWQKIDGIWYYFDASGYMAANEYVDGYWLNGDGSCADEYYLTWKCNNTGWWVEDISGWWPSNSWLKINGCWYYFDASGYMVTNKYIDGYWIGSDGVCS